MLSISMFGAMLTLALLCAMARGAVMQSADVPTKAWLAAHACRAGNMTLPEHPDGLWTPMGRATAVYAKALRHRNKMRKRAVRPFVINLVFTDEFNEPENAIFQNVFVEAKALWEEFLVGCDDRADGCHNCETTITADVQDIDGPFNTLGSAGPRGLACSSVVYSRTGVMTFDSADLARLASNRSLIDVILHEMAHVLGFGTLWSANDLIDDNVAGRYTGSNALTTYQTEYSQPGVAFIPLEESGGPGTLNSHWDEGISNLVSADFRFKDVSTDSSDKVSIDFEVLTGSINTPTYLSETSVQQFADLGYEIAVTLAATTLDISGADVAALAGQTETITIAVENTGTEVANNVVVTSVLDSGLTLVSTNGCSPENTLTCNLANSLFSTEVETFTITVLVDSGVANGAQLDVTSTVSANVAPSGGTLTTESTVAVDTIEHTLVMAVGNAAGVAGNQATFDITVENQGPSDASGVRFDINLPSELSVDSVSGCGAVDTSSSPIECLNVDIATGATATVSVTVDIASSASGSLTVSADSLTSSATVLSGSVTNDDGTVTVSRQATLAVSKTAGSSSVDAGESLTYTIEVTNNGPSDTTNVQVAETLPTGVSNAVTAGCNNGATAGASNCELGSLVAGGVASFTLTVDVDSDVAAGTISNSVTASSDDSLSDATATESVTVTRSSTFSLDISDSPDPAFAGESLVYTVQVTNDGPSDSDDFDVPFTIPTGTTFVQSSVCVDTSDSSSCALSALTAGMSVDFTVTVTVASSASRGDTLTFAAQASGSTVSESTTINTQTALVVDVDDTTAGAVAGSTVSFDVSITNNGPSDATDVQLDTILPSDLTLNTISGCSASNSLTCALTSDLSVGAVAVVTITVDVASSVANGASLSVESTVSSSTSLTAASVATDTGDINVVRDVTLALVKTALAGTVDAGDTISFAIQVTNNGPSDADGVSVAENLPAGVTNAQATGCSNSDFGAVSRCDVGTLVVGGTADIVVSVDVPASATAGSTLLNEATASNTDTADTSTDTASVSVSIDADLQATFTTSVDPVLAGNSITYFVTVVNNGPSDAASLVVPFTLPTNAVFSSSVDCATSVSTGCDIGALLNGGTYTFEVVLIVDDDAADGDDVVFAVTLDGDVFSETATVNREADLTVDVADATGVAGQSVTFDITVENAGPSVASDVSIAITLPSFVTLNEIVNTSPCNSFNSLTCVLDSDIAVGETKTISVTVDLDSQIADASSLSLSATATASQGLVGTLTDSGTLIVTRTVTLAITNSVANTVDAGASLVYTIEVENSGPSDAANVVVDRFLPGTGVSNAQTSGCTNDAASLSSTQCTLGSLAAGSTESFTLTVSVDSNLADGTVLSTGVQASSDEATTTLLTTPVTVTIDSALVVSFSSFTPAALAGDPFSFTVTVQNNGPSDAADVEVALTIPADVTFDTFDAVCGATSTDSNCVIGTIAASDSASFEVTVEVPASAALGSLLSFTADAGTRASATATRTATVSVEAEAVLTVNDAAAAIAGETATFTFDVVNNGPSELADIVVALDLPTSLTLLSTTGCDVENQLSCAFANDLDSGDSNTVTVVVNVASDAADGATVQYEATLTSSTTLSTTSVSTDSGQVALTREAQLTATKVADDATLVSGSTVTYSITVANAGPSDAENVVIAETLPAGLINVVTTCGSDPSSCTAGTIEAGDSFAFTVTADIDVTLAATTLANVIGVTSDTTLDASSVRIVTAPITVTRPEIDLTLTLTDGGNTNNGGREQVYTIVVTNNGPDPSFDTLVTVTLPSVVTLVSATGCAGNTLVSGVCDIGDVANGGVVTIVVTTEIDLDATGVISASVSVTSASDETAAGDESGVETTTVLAPQVDLSMAVLPTPDPALQDEQLTFTVQISNAGPDEAIDSVLSISVPDSTLVSTNGCANDGAVVSDCNVDSVASGGTTTVEVVVLLDLDAPSSVASTFVATADPVFTELNSADNTEVVTVTVNERSTDLRITFEASGEVPLLADEPVTYIATVFNDGVFSARDIVLTFALDSTITLLSTTGCAEDPNGGTTCTLSNDLASGSSVAVVVVGNVPDMFTGDISSSVSVVSASTDTDASNNAAVTTTAVVPSLADLRVTASASANELVAGLELLLTAKVFNAGPRVATAPILNIGLNDDAVASVRISSCLNGNNAACELSAIDVGETREVTVRVTIDAAFAGTLDISFVVKSDVPDPDNSNDSATASITVVEPVADLQLVASVKRATVSVNSQVAFAIAVTNLGTDVARDIVLTGTLSNGLTFQRALGCSSDLSDCRITPMKSGETREILVTALSGATPGVSATGEFRVTSSTRDPDSDNNDASADVVIGKSKEVSVKLERAAGVTLSRIDLSRGSTPANVVVQSSDAPRALRIALTTDVGTSGADVRFETTSCGRVERLSDTRSLWTPCAADLSDGATLVVQLTGTLATRGAVRIMAAALSDDADELIVGAAVELDEQLTVVQPTLPADTFSLKTVQQRKRQAADTLSVAAGDSFLWQVQLENTNLQFTFTGVTVDLTFDLPDAARLTAEQDTNGCGTLTLTPSGAQWRLCDVVPGAQHTLSLQFDTDERALTCAPDTAELSAVLSNVDDVRFTRTSVDLDVRLGARQLQVSLLVDQELFFSDCDGLDSSSSSSSSLSAHHRHRHHHHQKRHEEHDHDHSTSSSALTSSSSEPSLHELVRKCERVRVLARVTNRSPAGFSMGGMLVQTQRANGHLANAPGFATERWYIQRLDAQQQAQREWIFDISDVKQWSHGIGVVSNHACCEEKQRCLLEPLYIASTVRTEYDSISDQEL